MGLQQQVLFTVAALALLVSACAPVATPSVPPTNTSAPTAAPTATPTAAPTAKPTPDPVKLAETKAAAIEACLHGKAPDFQGTVGEMLRTARVSPPDVKFSDSLSYPYTVEMIVWGFMTGEEDSGRDIVQAGYHFEQGQWALYSFSDPYLPGVEGAKERLDVVVPCL